MPVTLPTTTVLGPSRAHNQLGAAVRTLGGLFSTMTVFPEFGTLTANPFVEGARVALGEVVVPGYTLTQGACLRLSFSGSLLWDNGAGVGEPVQIGLLITPTAVAANFLVDLGLNVNPGGAAVTNVFGGVLEMVALEAPSIDSDVGTSIQFTDLAGSGAGASRLVLPGATTPGILALNTAGLAAGTRLEIVATMSNGAFAQSVRRIRLQRFTTELYGG